MFYLSDGREVKVKLGFFFVRCVFVVDNLIGSNDVEVVSVVVFIVVIVVVVVVKVVVGVVKVLGRILIGILFFDGFINVENEFVSVLKGRLVLVVGFFFLVLIS